MGFCDFFILQIFSSFFADFLRIFCGFFCRFFCFFPVAIFIADFLRIDFPLLLQNRSLFVPSFKCQVVIAVSMNPNAIFFTPTELSIVISCNYITRANANAGATQATKQFLSLGSCFALFKFELNSNPVECRCFNFKLEDKQT